MRKFEIIVILLLIVIIGGGLYWLQQGQLHLDGTRREDHPVAYPGREHRGDRPMGVSRHQQRGDW